MEWYERFWMIDYLIAALVFHHKPVHISGVLNSSLLLHWGTDFRTFSNEQFQDITSYPEIIFHFPYNPIQIRNYKIRTSKDVFPVEWQISSSDTGEDGTWEEIVHGKSDSCPEKLQNESSRNQNVCLSQYTSSYEINKATKYSRYIKFKMLKNSYTDSTSNWKYLLHISGLDFGGNCAITTRIDYIRISFTSFIFIPLMLK